jgi:Zn-dependent peptidase ImmA (M78 family)
LVRAAWRLPLGPVANVTASIESAGGIVLKCAFGTHQIDAAHLWLPGLPPLFFVNRDAPGDRLRWTLAHEVGHAIMHRNPTSDVEEEANQFASEFLMPAHEIAHQLHGLTIQQAAILKQQWKVSMAAIVRRAFDLGCITERKYRTLNMSLGAQGYKKVEPFPIDVEEPAVVRQLVQMHRSELGYDDFDLAKLLFWPDSQFFGPSRSPTILRFDNRPFFAFVTDRPGRTDGPRRSSL